jgi:hypothetical protein
MTTTYDYHTNRAVIAAHGAEQRELAAEARHGGRYMTRVLNGLVGRYERGELNPAAVQAVLPHYPVAEAIPGLPSEMAVATVWQHSMSPAGDTGSGRGTTADYARRLAAGEYAPDGSYPKARYYTLDRAEAMVEWPIYRAALAAR